MRYRAILVNGPPSNKPVQGMASSLSSIKEWATVTLAQVDAKVYPQAKVEVYATHEELCLIIGPNQ